MFSAVLVLLLAVVIEYSSLQAFKVLEIFFREFLAVGCRDFHSVFLRLSCLRDEHFFRYFEVAQIFPGILMGFFSPLGKFFFW